MLVFSRKVNEKVIITAPDGTQITIELYDISKTKCRIGIAAPTSWTVHREEIQNAIDSNGK
jgi:carbon storage regulator CsrA